MVVNATGHLRQHPNEAGGGFEVALLRRRLEKMWLLMEFSSKVSLLLADILLWRLADIFTSLLL